MELKKNPSKDIYRRYPMHFFAGLCISCGLVIGLFELKFKKEPIIDYDVSDWDNAIALIDPVFQVERPVTTVKRIATPARVVRTVVPATITIATEPAQETPVITQGDPFVPDEPVLSAPSAAPATDGPVPYAEEMPQPIDGFEKFYKQIARDVRYPRAAASAEVQGKVFVEFVVDRDGTPTFVRVVRGIGYGCDEQAVKALSKTRWKPGRQHGAAVRVRMIMPIQFSLTR